jgi:hypothetical protein
MKSAWVSDLNVDDRSYGKYTKIPHHALNIYSVIWNFKTKVNFASYLCLPSRPKPYSQSLSVSIGRFINFNLFSYYFCTRAHSYYFGLTLPMSICGQIFFVLLLSSHQTTLLNPNLRPLLSFHLQPLSLWPNQTYNQHEPRQVRWLVVSVTKWLLIRARDIHNAIPRSQLVTHKFLPWC